MTNRNPKRRSRNRCAVAVTSAVLFSHAATSAVLEEVVVTAQKRTESLQEVPIAISAFGSAQIKELGVSDLRELTGHIPGVELFDDSIPPLVPVTYSNMFTYIFWHFIPPLWSYENRCNFTYNASHYAQP